MKKTFLKFSLHVILALFATITVAFAQKPDPKTTDAGVVINGVKWATRNVDAFGTFAATPESPGMFYQWNRKKAWSATTPAEGIAIGEAGGWDDTYPTGTTWEKSNDPSPKGWRVPTKAELQSLFDTQKVSNVWTTQNGVTGRKFTDKATGNSVFFPAAGYRSIFDGTLCNSGTGGNYWCSTGDGSSDAYNVHFSSGSTDVSSDSADVSSDFYRTDGLSVRSVAE